MKNKVSGLLSALCLFGAIPALSQSQLDALRYSRTDGGATARTLSMAGAFGALGGDLSVMALNPGALGVYGSSEWVMTMGKASSHSKLNVDNFGYVGTSPTGSQTGVLSWTTGFAYQRVKDFRRQYSYSLSPGQSISDYIAVRGEGYDLEDLDDPNAYDNGVDWLPALGYQAGLIDYFGQEADPRSAFGDVNLEGRYVPYNLSHASLQVEEQGKTERYLLGAAINIDDRLYAGFSLAILDLDYSYSSTYDEKFTNDDDLFLDNSLITKGTGFGLSVGFVGRPTDYLRLGVAYRSPVWYTMTDYFYAAAGSSVTIGEDFRLGKAQSPDGAFFEYSFRSPPQWLFSAAAICSQYGLISLDYEVTDYGDMGLFERHGETILAANRGIKANMGRTGTVRIGGEWKVSQHLALRAGWSYSEPAVQGMLGSGFTDMEGVVAGTIPHFTIDKGTRRYSVGIGYRLTTNLYADAAWLWASHKEKAYPFPQLDYEPGQPIGGTTLVTHRRQLAFTVGYKF
ncbi:MAG: hypothetical protein LBU03_02445 [Tannerellaceae bacterium]|jgi:hypothetical protein|nr:hypothetical protein [Tannerellaceae bacterium]